MATNSVFTATDPDLLPILEELRRREPIFHRPEFASGHADFAAMTSQDYWEVGASGRRYSRGFILKTLSDTTSIDASSAGWRISDEAVRRLGPDTYLFTYTLLQGDRLTRRATIWRSIPAGWTILYHQGTVASAGEDDVAPPTDTAAAMKQ